MSRSAQGIEAKTKDRESEKLICLGSHPIKERLGFESQILEIPEGAEYVKAKKRKINFYKGPKPENNGYTKIPMRALTVYLADYKDRGGHVVPGEFRFQYGIIQQ